MNPTNNPPDYAIDPTDGDVIDVGAMLAGDPNQLRCSKCRGGVDEAAGGAMTRPVRYDDDPDSVVRCARCGKKHSTNSLS